jgi:PhnB protein
MGNKVTNLIPYLYFSGTCEEALNFYNKIFNGKLTIEDRYDNPAMNAPKECHDRVLHATLEFEGHKIMACDVLPGDEARTKTGNVSLSIHIDNAETGKMIFEQLSKGGNVRQVFAKQFWGAWYSDFIDQYGISWMVHCE